MKNVKEIGKGSGKDGRPRHSFTGKRIQEFADEKARTQAKLQAALAQEAETFGTNECVNRSKRTTNANTLLSR